MTRERSGSNDGMDSGERQSFARQAQGARAAGGNALALALDGSDWERAALLLLLGVSQVARTLPRTTIDDVLAVIDLEEALDDDR